MKEEDKNKTAGKLKNPLPVYFIFMSSVKMAEDGSIEQACFRPASDILVLLENKHVVEYLLNQG